VTGHDPWEQAAAAATAIAARTGVASHEVAVVLGSGWAVAADGLGELVAEVPVGELPGFAAPAVLGHVPTVRSVRTGSGRAVLVLLGRVHAYEGHGQDAVVHGVRSAVLSGCRSVLLTNAAGGLRAGLQVGQPVLIADHLNLTGTSPLLGPAAPPELAPARFVDLTEAWSPRLRALARAADPSLEEGVYAGLLGPQYETPAEIRMLRTLGADLVGMSTVSEAIAARHLGAEVLGLSLVTNLAAGLGDTHLDHVEVLKAGASSASSLAGVLAAVADQA
jgi:purine-nucleoside phosphorylase